MSLRRFHVIVFLITFLGGYLVASAKASASNLGDLFQKREWEAMAQTYAAIKEKSPRDHALMANAYRLREQWGDAVAILEAHAASFPSEIRPYAHMTLLLGLEKLGRTSEALKLAYAMEKGAPVELHYYIGYAQIRLLGDRDPEASKKVLLRMLHASESKERKIFVLERLIKHAGNLSQYALKLLELQPNNKLAYEYLTARPKPWSPAVYMALGQYAYLKGDYKSALALLGTITKKDSLWRKASYYRAYALSKSKPYAEAVKLWGNLAMSGNAYAESSVRRLGGLSDKVAKEDLKAILKKIAKTRKGKVQARAMFVLSGMLESEEAQKIENDLIQAYPDSPLSLKLLWKRGWEHWQAKSFKEAAWYWQRAYAPNIEPTWGARALYWIAAAQKAGGESHEAQKSLKDLTRRYPLSYYAFLAQPNALKLVDGDHPALVSEPNKLEQWGFIAYARLQAQRPGSTPKELYRSLLLADWLGERDTYTQARQLSRYFTSGTTLYKKGLQYLYPRPYGELVDAAAKKYGVEDNLVWSVMRQESAFKSNATSWAGASGLMQLMPGTAKDEAKKIGLKNYNIYDVKDNIEMGTAHLARLGKSFDRKDWVMAAYNAGSGNARKWLADGRQSLTSDFWIEHIRFDETCDYVQKVSGNLEVYRLLYGTASSSSLISGDLEPAPSASEEDPSPEEDTENS